jgi:2-hydroxychromene-2-carboxylate isomerase
LRGVGMEVGQVVARAFYWLFDHEPEAAKPFAQAALREHFVHQRNLEMPESVVSLAGGFLSHTAELSDWLRSDAAKQRLRSMTEEAVRKGVFGSPFFIADGEPFWGWDRMPMLEDWLRRGRWP